MRYLKKSNFSYLFFALCLSASGAWAAPAADVSACLEQGKNQFSAKNYLGAQDTFARCLRLDPHNVDAELSLAGVYMTQDNLDNAEKYFREALTHMKRNSPYYSYTYSMLGDIALKKLNYKEATNYYDRSLSFNAANVNSLVGKGVITEYNGDKLGASDFYRAALAVEPLNVIARKRLINLEPDYLTDEEMLDALKQRYAVAPEKTELTEDDRKVFTAIHSSEQRRGIDYLKNKYPKIPAEYVVTLYKDTPFSREVLTLAGYKTLQKQIGQDAINVFQKGGVPIRDVFDLRDMKGNKIFNEDSTLTDSGFFVYTEALQNRKAFLLPKEPVPPTQKDLEKVAARVRELDKAGYVEISYSELKMIENQTKCSQETMRKHMGLYVLPVTSRDRRYFVQARSSGDDRKGIPYYYLMAWRAKRNPNIKVPKNALVESYQYYNYTVCMEGDGTLWE